MTAWIAIFIPIMIMPIVGYFFFKKIVWWEYALMIAPSILLILFLQWAMVSSRMSDTEYLGAYTTKVIYYQSWDEEVSCRHPIYCEEEYECGTSDHPETCTREYVCGYEHPYDVDFHPECWTKLSNTGAEFDISKYEFVTLQKRFGTVPYFVELNRDYHSIDGDAYDTNFNGKAEDADVLTTIGSYRNKIKASHSIFKFEDISEKEKAQWKLYDYPEPRNLYQQIVLGSSIDNKLERRLQYINGLYGSKKQFRMYILFFTDQSLEVAFKQRSYWEGGNKNEFVICLGVDKTGKYQWVKCFSWMDKPELEVPVEKWFAEQSEVDLNAFANWMPEQVSKHWERKQFKDFEYLDVEITDTQLTWMLIIIALYNIGISIWIINNEFEN